MPVKLIAGVSKKQGLPNYGSAGATCHVEVELDGSLLQNDLETFQCHVRNVYVACSQAVNDELARQCADNSDRDRPTNTEQSGNNGNESAGHNGNGNSQHHASQRQLDYMDQLASQIHGLGAWRLDTLVNRMHGKSISHLTSLEASAVIDTLKAIKDGRVDVNAVLDGAPT